MRPGIANFKDGGILFKCKNIVCVHALGPIGMGKIGEHYEIKLLEWDSCIWPPRESYITTESITL